MAAQAYPCPREVPVSRILHRTDRPPLAVRWRGVIIGIDPIVSSSNDQYEAVVQSRPPKDMPWYHVPKDGTLEGACVAERNLEAGDLGQAIRHPDLKDDFTRLTDGIDLSLHASG